MSDQKKDPRTYAIIGAAMEVHKELGPGLLESPYQEAMEIELEQSGVPFEAQPIVQILYKGRELKSHYRPDFICYAEVVVEIKAQKQLAENDEASDHQRAQVREKESGLADQLRRAFLGISPFCQLNTTRFELICEICAISG